MERVVLLGLTACSLLVAAQDPVTVTLYDTAAEPELNWVTFNGANSSAQGWREASINNPQGDVSRVYTACDIAVGNVNNWLRTPYVGVGDTDKRLYIYMEFTIRKCLKYPDPERLQQCKESFKLLYYEAESDFANAAMPTWDVSTWRHIDVIAADQTSVDSTHMTTNTEERSIAVSRKGVYFAFLDQGACMTVTRVRIYYIMCPSVVRNFAIFPNTTTGTEVATIVQAEGECVPHAAIEVPPKYLCKGDGTWNYLQGGCVCMPGYEPDRLNERCLLCPRGKYKWRTETAPCRPCPEHSEAPHQGAVECSCSPGYYRHVSDDRAAPCTRPPSTVRSLSVVRLSHASVALTWEVPADLGGRRDLEYRVECRRCPPSAVYTPLQAGFNTSSVTVAGLTPDSEYQVVVYALNGVSDQSDKTISGTDVVFKTDAAIPSKVRNVRVTSVGMDYISLAWDGPTDPAEVAAITQYEVRYHMAAPPPGSTNGHNSSAVVAVVTKTNATFNRLVQQTEYIFQVRGKTSRGWGEYSDSIAAKTGHMVYPGVADGINRGEISESDNNPVGIIAGSAVAVVVCMLIVIIMVVIFLRRNHRACNEKNVSDCDTLQYSNVQCSHILESAAMMNGGVGGVTTLPLFVPPAGVKTYIDPHTYEDPNQAVREFTKEIDAASITIEAVIGGGEFGDVCKGKLRLPNKAVDCLPVAIKTLKAGASDKNRLDFLTEASIMGQFDDPNVIYLEGVVTKSNPIMIVTEYMENGSLDTFLRNNDGKFTVIQLTGMMRGIASGMRYLADMGYVHRDLAARNILVNETLVCKVADFGLSREIESDDTDGAYTTKGGKIPVRWTAPEAIAYRKFTSASDVWSYGVVMWEVMSYGERPYWNWSNQDVIKAVDKGFRLPPPMDCPESIYQLMLDTWQKERAHRPKFTQIVKTHDKLIRSPELLRKLAKQRPHQFIDPNHPDLTRYDASVDEWLASIKMDRYAGCFRAAGVLSMERVAALTLAELAAPPLAVTLAGHQKKIMNSIHTLRAMHGGGGSSGAGEVSEGFLV